MLPRLTLRDAITRPSKLGEPKQEKVEHPENRYLHHYGWPGAREYPGHTPTSWTAQPKRLRLACMEYPAEKP